MKSYKKWYPDLKKLSPSEKRKTKLKMKAISRNWRSKFYRFNLTMKKISDKIKQNIES